MQAVTALVEDFHYPFDHFGFFGDRIHYFFHVFERAVIEAVRDQETVRDIDQFHELADDRFDLFLFLVGHFLV